MTPLQGQLFCIHVHSFLVCFRFLLTGSNLKKLLHTGNSFKVNNHATVLHRTNAPARFPSRLRCSVFQPMPISDVIDENKLFCTLFYWKPVGECHCLSDKSSGLGLSGMLLVEMRHGFKRLKTASALCCRSDAKGSASSCCGCRPYRITAQKSSTSSSPVWCQASPPYPHHVGPALWTPSSTTPIPTHLRVSFEPGWTARDLVAASYLWCQKSRSTCPWNAKDGKEKSEAWCAKRKSVMS